MTVTATANASMEKPIWSTGDSWTYAFAATSGFTSVNGTLKLTVVGSESVSINGTSYPSYNVTGTLTEKSGSLTISYDADLWFSVDTLAIVQITATSTIGTGTVTFTIAGNPPQLIRWPLTTGDSWTSATSVRVKTQYPNGTVTNSYQALSTTFLVQTDATITVPAGTFTTTPLKETTSGSYTVNYWSAQVGNWARVGAYNSSGGSQGGYNLTSYNYQGGQGASFLNAIYLGLPGFAWLIVIAVVIIAVVAIIATRRRKPGMPMAMPPGQLPMQPMPPQEPMGPGGPPPGSMP